MLKNERALRSKDETARLKLARVALQSYVTNMLLVAAKRMKVLSDAPPSSGVTAEMASIAQTLTATGEMMGLIFRARTRSR